MGGEGFGFCDARESAALLDHAFASGICHFDTAGFYAHGKSEKLLARLAGKDRESIFISSKGGLVWHGRNVFHRGSKEALRQSLYESLKRLKTDYLDLYQLHWPDPEVALEESLDALREFQQEGLIRNWGVCNLTARQVERHIAEFSAIAHQVRHNLIHRSDDILQAGKQQERCCNITYSPLEQGLLSNSKSSFGVSWLGKRDFRRTNHYFHSRKVSLWVERLRRLAKERQMPIAVIALAWNLSLKNVHGVIVGPKTVAQLNMFLKNRSCLEMERSQLIEYLGEELWAHLSHGVTAKP